MSSRRDPRRAVLISLASVLFSIGAGAQVGTTEGTLPQRVDPFASVHQSLNRAADRTLARTDQEWRKESEPAAVVASQPSLVGSADTSGRFAAALLRVDQLRPTIGAILREEGIPLDLSAVVLVESGGLPTALSPKGARGIWQFMPDTARRYGLLVSADSDERLNVAKSTRAAARYLRDLHQQFGDWQLAFAAYNAGEQLVGRTLARSQVKSYSAIANQLPPETRNYVPAVMSAMLRLQENDVRSPQLIVYAPVVSGN